MTTSWPFEGNETTLAITSGEIIDRSVPILYVSHKTDEDGEIVWQFHHEPHIVDFAPAKLVRGVAQAFKPV